jgi:hypothetical protein
VCAQLENDVRHTSHVTRRRDDDDDDDDDDESVAP